MLRRRFLRLVATTNTGSLRSVQRSKCRFTAPSRPGAAAFFSDEDGRDIQQSLIDYVANFVTVAAGRQFNPPVTIGVGAETYLNQMLADPFASFTFSAAGASVYQLGSFGSARKELRALRLTR